MPYCPVHGPKEGRFCPDCGVELQASPPTGDSIRIRSPEAHANVQVVVPGPGVVPGLLPDLECPECGFFNVKSDVFNCRGCGRQNLCKTHFDKEYKVCESCAEKRRGIAQQEAARQAKLQAELAEWRQRAGRAEAALAQATQERDRRARELAEAQARLRQAEQAAAAATAEWQAKAAGLEQALAEWRGRAERAEAQLAEIARKEREAEAARRKAAEEAQQRKELELELAPGVKLTLVRVPAGEFLMGSEKKRDPDAADDELPQHRLHLAEYWIGKYPVTVAQFAAFVEATGYKTTSEQTGGGWNWTGSEWKEIRGASWRQPRGPGSDVKGKADHPVTLVSWHDAVAFCQWASRVTGRTVRLPTEAEWEKAARGTDGRIYPWGDAAPTEKLCNFAMNVKDTTPVGRYSPAGDSPYGCADMAGNVWEWTGSLYESYPYRADDGREDPNAGGRRVVRGGSWFNGQGNVRAAYRGRGRPVYRGDDLGIRCALSP